MLSDYRALQETHLPGSEHMAEAGVGCLFPSGRDGWAARLGQQGRSGASWAATHQLERAQRVRVNAGRCGVHDTRRRGVALGRLA